MSSTEENLKTALSGESQASRWYRFFADKAEAEGYPVIARLFRAAAESEAVHARSYFEILGGIGSTAENLKAAIKGESYEFTSMYPAFVKQAKADKNKAAEVNFGYASAVEKIHHRLFQEILQALEAGEQPKEAPYFAYFVCKKCGNLVSGEAPKQCPICGAPRASFKRVGW